MVKNLISKQLSDQIGGGASLRFINAAGAIDTGSLGYQIAIDTLTAIRRDVVEQKFFEIPFADFVPLVVGEGAFAQNILTNLVLSTGEDFEAGNINTGHNNTRISTVDAGVTPKTVQVINWAKEIGYTVFDIQQAVTASNWDLIEGKLRALKKNWDLGLQEIAFLGSKTNAGVPGLLTSKEVNVNKTLITKALAEMTADELNAFAAKFLSTCFDNANKTQLPNRLLLPASDYLGLVNAQSAQFAIKSKLEFLEEAFAKVVPGFKITFTPYGELASMKSRGVTATRYVAYRNEAETARMDVPVDFQTTAPNSLNNFSFQSVAYGQYTGAQFYRPAEALYFDIDE
jgi:hypothetical protein